MATGDAVQAIPFIDSAFAPTLQPAGLVGSTPMGAVVTGTAGQTELIASLEGSFDHVTLGSTHGYISKNILAVGPRG